MRISRNTATASAGDFTGALPGYVLMLRGPSSACDIGIATILAQRPLKHKSGYQTQVSIWLIRQNKALTDDIQLIEHSRQCYKTQVIQRTASPKSTHAGVAGVMTWSNFHNVATNLLLSSESVQQPSASEALCGTGIPWDDCNWHEVYQNFELLQDLSYVPREA